MSYDFLQAFHAGIHSNLYKSFMLFPAGRMNTKSKIRIYKKTIEEVCREYDGARGFITNKVNRSKKT